MKERFGPTGLKFPKFYLQGRFFPYFWFQTQLGTFFKKKENWKRRGCSKKKNSIYFHSNFSKIIYTSSDQFRLFSHFDCFISKNIKLKKFKQWKVVPLFRNKKTSGNIYKKIFVFKKSRISVENSRRLKVTRILIDEYFYRRIFHR